MRGHGAAGVAVFGTGGSMTKRDWERDRRNHLPKEFPVDKPNDDVKKDPPARKAKPPILEEIARQTRSLSTVSQTMGPATPEKAVKALSSLVHTYVAKTGQSTVEIQNARRVLERIAERSKVSIETAPKSYRLVRSASARRPVRRANIKRAKRRKWRA